ncbi:MAG: hypothetical protein WC023_01660 [Rhodocyclaceae bacterium]
MKTITATVPAHITSSYCTLDSLEKCSPERAISALGLYQPSGDDNPPDGWVKVGTAEVTVTFDDQDVIVGNQVAMLKAAKTKVQADCEIALNQLEAQIQSLLCIEHKE